MRTKSGWLIILFSLNILSLGEVRLPRIISNGMVLQRDAEVKIWGWATPQEKITIQFLNTKYRTTADAQGNWTVTLKNLPAGGPHKMTIQGTNQLTIEDILIGDVWVCSGQSNMELPMARVRWIYEDEIAQATNPYIRNFTVPQRYNFKQMCPDLDGGSWQAADPQSVLTFSAVAYFFAKELYQKLGVPIGLIQASLGGSPAEAWMSETALKEFPQHYAEAQRFRDDFLIKQIESTEQAQINAWYEDLRRRDLGLHDPAGKWSLPAIETTGWDKMQVPELWAETALGATSGVVWFRKEFEVPPEFAQKSALLTFARIIDSDSTFINGKFIGGTTYEWPPRRYPIPTGVLKPGRNVIVVRVVGNRRNGGFVPGRDYVITAGKDSLNLAGTWQARLGAVAEPCPSQTFIRWKPMGLFNGMIAPLLNYRLKGVIWYQGESNTGRALEYRQLFPAMINDWRKHWNQGDFPFLFVQLSAFMLPNEQPSESDWALLREAQLKTLSVPNTGMVVTIDIGETWDIHPLNKKEVGARLARAAFKITYGDTQVVHSGPIYQSMQIAGNKIILSFANIGSGLVAKGGALRQFAIAGKDRRFVWANAEIVGEQVVVWSEQVPEPVAVRYAWADNPSGANLYNKEGLPASPFRTDEW